MTYQSWRLAPGFSPIHLGILPEFISEYDDRSAVDQINEAYAHGGGWRDFKGFTFSLGDNIDPFRDWTLTYPEDPPYRPLAYLLRPTEYVVFFPYSWVMVLQRDLQSTPSFRIAHID